LAGLRVGLKDRGTSGENEILPENLKAEIRIKVSYRTYSPEPKRMVQDVTRDIIFIQPSHHSCFPYSRVVLVKIGLIEGFPQIWRTQIVWNSRRHVTTLVSFNSHNACYYFSMHCTTILCTKKTCIFVTLIVYTRCT
jgi:hypothetical protein